MRIIDSHFHLWQFDRGDYPWPNPDNLPLQRDFLPQDVTQVFDKNDVSCGIVVQAAPTIAETEFLCRLADASPRIAGVVGWVDLGDVDAQLELSWLARNPYVKGVRPMLQRMPDANWMLGDLVVENLSLAARCGLLFEALIQPRHLQATENMAKRLPELSIVVDHCAKPHIGSDGAIDTQWYEGMARLARLPNVSCKLSGLISEAGPDWTVERLRPVVDAVLTLYGPERIMWGSDWPVVSLNAGYADWLDTAKALTTGLANRDLALIFGGTAARIYGLDT